MMGQGSEAVIVINMKAMLLEWSKKYILRNVIAVDGIIWEEYFLGTFLLCQVSK